MTYDDNGALIATQIEGLDAPVTGKVRDIYDLGDSLLMIASDRISAFDCIMPNGIPDKGKVLTGFTEFWLNRFSMPNHLISMDPDDYPEVLKPYKDDLTGRSMLVKKAQPLPVECVARGYIIGSGWKDYQSTGGICGISLRDGYSIADKLDSPIFTPAFKAEFGNHDENITFDHAVELMDLESAEFVRDKTLELYSEAADFALTKGIIIADTKFEFGRYGDEIIIIDEVLTPDSSRFWPADKYEAGQNPPSLDKQYVRDYLEGLDWDKTPPAPELPPEVAKRTREIYLEAYEQLCGAPLTL